ncbi:MAG: hypothetical protein ACIAXF_11005 [Phycisphaerales bacterium JB063]
MAEIEVGQETETARHWAYDVRVFEGGRTYDYAVTLSFQDYDLWSRGRVAPSRVVEACFEYLLTNEGAKDISPKFDCSVIRRYFPSVDAELPKLL